MTCDNKTYIPNPPRLWNRVQLPCLEVDFTSTQYYEYLMLKKGNILQYKKNMSNFTNKQKYSLIVNKKWTNRNTTWATQNDKGYTNPNIKMLQRNNTINITLDGVETILPITCPSSLLPITNYYTLPNNKINQGNTLQQLPQIKEETSSFGNVFPLTPDVTNVEPIVIQDLGTLSCNVISNPCTSYKKTTKFKQHYHPTTDSDVPGQIQLLYWDDTTKSWHPKQRLKMNTSGNKWPYTKGPFVPYIPATAYDK